MNKFKCKNCGELVDFTDTKYCYSHEKSYCVWCAGDRHGSCGELKSFRAGELKDEHSLECNVDYDYPF